MDLPEEHHRYWVQVLPRYFKALNDHFGPYVQDESVFKQVSTSNGGLRQMRDGADVLETVQSLVRLAATKANPTESRTEQPPSTQNAPAIVGPPPDPIYSSVQLHEPKLQIRLIELLPGGPDNPLVVNLFVADSAGIHHYEAISYVWGSRDSDVTITVNGKQFDISANLADALRCLRPAEGKHGRILWVDAICINQASDADKSAQVAKMGEIYRRATNVLIFLGEEKDDSAMVMQYLGPNEPKLGEDEASANTTDQGQHGDKDQNNKCVIQRIQSCGFNPTQFFRAADAFFKRPWWSRLWVIQEFALARQQPWWHCGRLSVSTKNVQERLLPLFNCLINQAIPISGSPDVIIDTQINTGRQWITMPQRRYNIRLLLAFNSTEWEQLLPSPVMLRSLYRESTDPHDRIYALREMLEPVSRAVLLPDYSTPVNEVYFKLSSFLLIHNAWKDAIGRYELMQSSDMPSWTLNFAQPFPVASVGYQTSRRTESDGVASAYNRIMVIPGIVVDKLDIVCSFEDAKNDLHTLGLFWKMECLLQHHRSTEVLPEEASSAVPKHCYIPFSEESLIKKMISASFPTTPTIPGYAHIELEVAKAVLQPGPRFHPEDLTCDRWQDASSRPGDLPLMQMIFQAMQQPVAESLLGGACFDSANLRAQIHGVKLLDKKDLKFEPLSDKNSDDCRLTLNSMTPKAGDEYIPQYNHIKNILLQANSEAELEYLKNFVCAIADFCVATMWKHSNNGGLSCSQVVREFGSAFSSSNASLTSSWREIIDNCYCSGVKKYQHRGVLERLLSDAEGVEAAVGAQIQEATAALNRMHLDSVEVGNQVRMSMRREISGIFVSRRGFAGWTAQKRHSLKRGDILVVLDGVSAPTILEEVGSTGRYRMKAASSVVGIEDVDIGKLVELGLCTRMNFRIV